VIAADAPVEDVYRRHHARLWRALLSYTGDSTIASDAESEAFAQALRRGAAVDDVAGWVWRSAFRIADGLLQQRRRPIPVERDTRSGDDSLAEFLSMLGGLSAQQRQCVVMRYVGGYTPSEIAEIIETSPGTVRVQLHRAHAVLRAELRDEGAV
jgi:RNA polymerase sigma-70 factor (ECF subfamily)